MRRFILSVALLAPVVLVAQAAGPAVGDVAPDFTLPFATADGVAKAPLSLASLKGKTVVLAFFPKARTSGCTIQMRAYRDRYKEIFGDDVVLLAISRDSAAAQASWAADEHFPFRFVSDVDAVAGRLYGTQAEGRAWESRVLFVVGRDGRVATVMRPFREIDPTAYDELKAALTAARK